MRSVTHDVDLCVVGGGLSGLSAAVAAARHGARVVLVQDRPVLGGNASSEIRMHVCGAAAARGELRETGIVEEVQLRNFRRNPLSNWQLWDSVLYEVARFQEGLTLLLNCSCFEGTMAGSQLREIVAWQGTAETRHTIRARLFADCSGDSILAPITGAEFRLGREASGEFGEDIEPPVADRRTMGMSCLIEARETDRPQPFTPPEWAHVYDSCDALPERGHNPRNNFWWLELGGEDDSIHDTEDLRDELLKVAFGVWDHIKNHCRDKDDYENWALDWIGFLPGKRESRRYVGDHIVTQNDVRAEGRFEDLVAYGGWSMDDHHPAGFRHPGKPTIFHPAPAPYGIPYRALYSKSVPNLMFAGRNISATHAAMSSTRVMATCATMGQAVGVAAAIAAAESCLPRGIYDHHLGRLQQTLMDDDCYLPWHSREVPAISRSATLAAAAGDPEPLRSGVDRPLGDADNGWSGAPGDWVQYTFAREQSITEARIVADSQLDRKVMNMRSFYTLADEPLALPASLLRDFRFEARDGDEWRPVAEIRDNYCRLIRVPLATRTTAVRLVPQRTWGADRVRLFAFDLR